VIDLDSLLLSIVFQYQFPILSRELVHTSLKTPVLPFLLFGRVRRRNRKPNRGFFDVFEVNVASYPAKIKRGITCV